MRFQIGESVICINDDFRWAKRKYIAFNVTWPARGTCYVVRRYVIGGSHPAIVLRGIVNPRVPYNDGVLREAGFWDQRFMRAPKIDDLKKIAEETTRLVPEIIEALRENSNEREFEHADD